MATKTAKLRMCAGAITSIKKDTGEMVLCGRCGTEISITNIPSPNCAGYTTTIHLIPSDHPTFSKDPDAQDLSDADSPY